MKNIYILHVDDEPVVLKATKDYLEINYEMMVDSVDSGAKALEMIRENRYDAIVSDYEMPDMNGIEFLKRIRSSDREIPFIIFTEKGREDVVIDAMNEGADLYLRKGGNPKAQYRELVNGLIKLLEIRNAQKSLRESERTARVLLDASHSAAALLDREGIVIDANDAYPRIFGLTRQDLIGRRIWDLLPDDIAKKRKKVFDEVFKTKEPYKSSDIRWNGEWNYVVYPVNDDGGEVRNIAVFAMDVTERKKAEEALKVSEERYRNIVEDQTEFICRFLPDGTHVFVNEAYCRYFGKKCSEMTDRKFTPEIPAEDGERLKSLFRSLTPENPAGTIDHRIIMPDGEIRWQRWSDRAIFDAEGRITEYQSVGKDITDLMRTKEALEKAMKELRSAHQQLTDIINFLPDAIFAIDINRNIITWNSVMEEITGLSADDMLGKGEYEYSVPFYGERRPALVDLVLEEDSDLETHYPYIRREGDRLISELYSPYLYKGKGAHFWIVASPLYDTEGNVVGAIESMRDISRQKELERSLKTALDSTRRSNAELEQFAYVASHDLQEPLRMISSYVQLLARKYSGKLDSDADEYIAFAVDGADRMQRLINDLLDYSRVTTRGKSFEHVDCERMLYHVMEDMMIAIQENDVKITHDPLPVILADEPQISSVFRNLIGNAIKYRSDEKPMIHISAGRKGNEWLFSVRDNGIGIDPKYSKRIFIIFQRLHARDEYPGTGIGLAVSKKIIERHGGSIWVESEIGKGSTFYFTIPIGGESK